MAGYAPAHSDPGVGGGGGGGGGGSNEGWTGDWGAHLKIFVLNEAALVDGTTVLLPFLLLSNV